MSSKTPGGAIKKEPQGEPVDGYWVNFDIQSKSVRVWVRTNQSGWQMVSELPPEQAVLLTDMLLSGKQVYFLKGISLHLRED